MTPDELRAQLANLTDVVITLTEAILDFTRAVHEDHSTQPKQQTPKTVLTLREFLKEAQMSYSTYRKLRQANMTPVEIRLSGRMIRITRESADAWRAMDAEARGRGWDSDG